MRKHTGGGVSKGSWGSVPSFPSAMAHASPAIGPLSFFPGKRILLTGSTGFLGKIVLEKLLREVPDLAKVYLLIRPCPKKGTTPDVRLREEIIGTISFTCKFANSLCFRARN